jgi:hypothetical protein
MSKRKKKKRSTKAPEVAALPAETRAAEVATIWWMLSALFTFCAEAIGFVARVILFWQPGDEGLTPLRVLPYLMLGIGLVSGSIALLLTPVVYRLRQTPPPEMITVFVVLVGLVPPFTLAILLIRGIA